VRAQNHGARPRLVNLGAGGRRGVDQKREEPQTPPRLSPKLPAAAPRPPPPRSRHGEEASRLWQPGKNPPPPLPPTGTPPLAFWARLIWPFGRTRGTWFRGRGTRGSSTATSTTRASTTCAPSSTPSSPPGSPTSLVCMTDSPHYDML
jgi:hypothetical protein